MQGPLPPPSPKGRELADIAEGASPTLQLSTLNPQPSTLKIRANEQESSSLELFLRVQPKLNNAVVNSQPSTLNPQPSTLNSQTKKKR